MRRPVHIPLIPSACALSRLPSHLMPRGALLLVAFGVAAWARRALGRGGTVGGRTVEGGHCSSVRLARSGYCTQLYARAPWPACDARRRPPCTPATRSPATRGRVTGRPSVSPCVRGGRGAARSRERARRPGRARRDEPPCRVSRCGRRCVHGRGGVHGCGRVHGRGRAHGRGRVHGRGDERVKERGTACHRRGVARDAPRVGAQCAAARVTCSATSAGGHAGRARGARARRARRTH